jgi:hypothetical protein
VPEIYAVINQTIRGIVANTKLFENIQLMFTIGWNSGFLQLQRLFYVTDYFPAAGEN